MSLPQTPFTRPAGGLVPLVLLVVVLALAPVRAVSADPCDSITAERPTPTPACVAWISERPEPPVEPIDLDNYTLTRYSFWKVGPDAVHTYDAPNGAVIGQIAPGFNFVSAVNLSVEGWLQIEGGQWIRRDDARLVEASRFGGVLLPEGLEQPFAWVLDTTGIYASEYPGGPPSAATGRVPLRYERVNIYAEAADEEGWTWYMIGPGQWINQRFVGVAKPVDRPEGVSGRWVAIDLYEQTLVAYEEDTPVFATLVSTGLPPWDTPEGVYTVWARLAADAMSGAAGAPDAYALQSIPWVQYFNDSISLHGTYWHDLFGYRRSHGCVNLSISDARFVYEWMGEELRASEREGGNYVYVYSSGVYGSKSN